MPLPENYPALRGQETVTVREYEDAVRQCLRDDGLTEGEIANLEQAYGYSDDIDLNRSALSAARSLQREAREMGLIR